MGTRKLRHKFNAKAVIRQGKRYDSKLEGRYAAKLELAQKAGDLLFFLRQVPFDLPGGVKYRADFMEFWADGEVKVTDCKGMETQLFKLKKAQLEELYPFQLNIVKEA